jgi:MFS family permease
VVLPSLVVFGLTGTATVFVESFETLLVLRFLQGVGFAGLTPLTNVLVGDIYTGPSRSDAQGFGRASTGWRTSSCPSS